MWHIKDNSILPNRNKEIVEMEKVEGEEKAQGRKLIHDRGGLLNIG